MGYRFRLHQKHLPDCPDLVFAGRRKVVFVHGCFWHGHAGCKKASMPKSNLEFWSEKIERNRLRDRACAASLRRLSWKVLVVWQCNLKDEVALKERLRRFL